MSSDDELVRETILSPLLPATTMDKVLEKANADYESASQKECQDILDSIDESIDFDNLKDRAYNSSYQDRSFGASSEKTIPGVEGSRDDLFSTSCAGSSGTSFEIKKSEPEGSSESQELQDVCGRFLRKQRKKKSVWGSLPFSTAQKVNKDTEPVGFHAIDAFASENKDQLDTNFFSVNEAKTGADGLLKNENTDVHVLKESSTLVGCSVRDLMRRKRCYRVDPPDCGSGRVKRVLLERERREETFLGPRQLNSKPDRNPIESHNLKQSFTVQQKKIHNLHCPMHGNHHLLSNSETSSHGSRLNDGDFGSHKKVGREFSKGAKSGPVDFTGTDASQVHTIPGLCKTKNVDLAASKGHCEMYSCKESDVGASAMTNESFQQIVAAASCCLQADWVKCEVSDVDCSLDGNGHKDEHSPRGVHNDANDSLLGAITDSVSLLNEHCGGGKLRGDYFLSGLGSLESVVVDTQGICTEEIGLTFSKKPPVADSTDGASKNASFLPTTSNAVEENYFRTSGCIITYLHGMP